MEIAAQMNLTCRMEEQLLRRMRNTASFRMALVRLFGPRHPISRTRLNFHWSGWTGHSGQAETSAFLHLAYLWQLNYMCSSGNLLPELRTMTPPQITNQRMVPRILEAPASGTNQFARCRTPALLFPLQRRHLQSKNSKARDPITPRLVNMPAAHLPSGPRSSPSATVSSHEDEMRVFLTIEWSKPQCWALTALGNKEVQTFILQCNSHHRENES